MNWLKRCNVCGLPRTNMMHIYQHDYESRGREVVACVVFVALVVVVVALAVLMVGPMMGPMVGALR